MLLIGLGKGMSVDSMLVLCVFRWVIWTKQH